MRVTIIPEDRSIIVDGDHRRPCKRCKFPKGVRAIQWYGEAGEIEFDHDAKGNRLPNQKITDITPYKHLIEEHAKAKTRDENAQAEVKRRREAARKKMEEAEREMVEAEKLNDRALTIMDEGDD